LVQGREPKSIVANLGLTIEAGEIVALVGGSGSGKTTTGLAIMRLLEPGIEMTSGHILFEGQNLLELPPPSMRRVRGAKIGMVFQDPLSAFNPVFSIGSQIDEVQRQHRGLSVARARAATLDMLDVVGIPDPQRVYRSFPHQLSGGMRQRAMIAMAIAVHPPLLIADEPTSNLDVTLQARIMDLFRRLRQEMNIAILLITHDLGVVRHLAERVYVMCQGEVVEAGATSTILDHPTHRYTQRLMAAVAV